MANLLPHHIGEGQASGAQIIDGTLRFDKDKTTYLSKTLSKGNQCAWTWSGWIQRTHFDGGSNFYRIFGQSETNHLYFYENNLYFDMGSGSPRLITSQSFRDTGWYHLVASYDTNNEISSERMCLYLNGSEITAFGTESQPSQGSTSGTIGTNALHTIGYRTSAQGSAGGALSANMSGVCFVNGQAVGPGYFGYKDLLTNTWRPKSFDWNASTVNNGTVWSSGTTNGSPYSGSYTWTTAFNGTPLNSYGATESGTSTNPYNIALPDIPFSSLTLYTQHGGANGIWVNGIGVDCSGNVSLGSGADSQTVGMITFTSEQLGFGILNQIGVNGQNRWFGLAVDGVLMVDSLGSGFDKNPNYGATWSSGMVAAGSGGWKGGHGAATSFDGGVASRARSSAPSNNGLITFTPATAISYSKSVRAYNSTGDATMYSATWSLNGGGANSISTTGWQTIATGSGTLTSLSTTRNGDGEYFAAIEIDGYILIDDAVDNSFEFLLDGSAPIGKDQSGKGNDWTPMNFCEAETLPEATGGLPILNTQNGGNLAAVGVRTDSNSTSLELALPLVGGPTVQDYSHLINGESSQKTATPSGSVPNYLYSNFYGGSYYFDGVNDEIVITSTDFSPGTGPFTIELWFYALSLPNTNNRLLTSGNNTSSGQKSHYQMMVKNTGALEINYDTTAGYVIASDAGLVGLNQWHHFAMTRDSASPPNMSIWLDGKKVASEDDDTGFDSNNTEGIVIGRESTGSNWWNGYISDVRFYKAVCKYTSNFTVPSINPAIGPGAMSGIPYSSSLTKTSGGGSVGFNVANTDYLGTWVSSADFTIAGDFTVECWVYPTDGSSSANDGIWQFSTTAGGIETTSSGLSMEWEYTGSSGNRFNVMAGTDSWENSSTNRASHQWYHIAMVRSSGTIKTYVNGVEDISFSNSDTFSMTYAVVGGYYSTSHLFNGKISNFRFVNGTAVYTGNFTPPTELLTPLAPSPSSALNDGKIWSSGGDNANINASYPWSKAFDGTTDGSYSNGAGATDGAGWARWTPPVSVVVSTSLRINTDNGTTSAVKVKFSGETEQHLTSLTDGWTTVSGTGTLEYIEIYNSGTTWSYLCGVEVDGTVLVDGNTKLLCCQSNDAAAAASVSPNVRGSINRGVVWSEQSSITPPASGFNSGGEIQFAFDGLITTLTSGAGSRSEFFVIYFAKPITVSTSLEVYMSSGSSQFAVNGGSYAVQDSGAWRNLSFTGTLGTLSVRGDVDQTYGNNAPRLSAIRIDGSTILTDPISPAGEVSVASNYNPFLKNNTNTVLGRPSGYCILNPVAVHSGTFSKSDLGFEGGSAAWCKAVGSIQIPSSGKYYFEGKITGGGAQSHGIGFAEDTAGSTESDLTTGDDFYCVVNNTGTTVNKVSNGTATSLGTIGGFSTGDVFGLAVDGSTKEIWIHKDGVWFSGLSPNNLTAFLTGSGNLFPVVWGYNTGGSWEVNFGQKPFRYAPPEGFQALNGANLPLPEIVRPDQFVGVTTYPGNGGTKVVSTLGFQPDLVVFKSMTSTNGFQWQDSVRGATKVLYSNTNGAEETEAQSLQSFDFHGYTTGSFDNNNKDGEDYVAWAWKSGGNLNTFNKDDVGYASASDVNMAVGDLNSVAYNQEKVWSDYLTAGTSLTDATKAFNGEWIQNSGQSGECARDSGVNGSVTFTPTSLSTLLTGELEVYSWVDALSGTSYTRVDVYESGILSDQVELRSDKWANKYAFVSVGTFTNITKIVVHGTNGGGAYLGGVMVGGKELVNNGITINAPSIAATGASVGTKQGFSIIKYTGNNDTDGGKIPHGLDGPPEFCIFKDLDGTDVWHVHHKDLSIITGGVGGYDYLQLGTNGNYAEAAPGATGITNITSSVVTFGSNRAELNGANDFIAYMWQSIPGLQKFGKYEGTNSSDGPFIELGFRPAIMIFKDIDAAQNWIIIDDKRSTYNVSIERLFPNSNLQQYTNHNIGDFLSNGFKFRGNEAQFNNSETYIYGAWAYQPEFNFYGAQSNAR